MAASGSNQPGDPGRRHEYLADVVQFACDDDGFAEIPIHARQLRQLAGQTPDAHHMLEGRFPVPLADLRIYGQQPEETQEFIAVDMAAGGEAVGLIEERLGVGGTVRRMRVPVRHQVGQRPNRLALGALVPLQEQQIVQCRCRVQPEQLRDLAIQRRRHAPHLGADEM